MSAPNPRSSFSMNGLIRELADRGRPAGMLDRLRGAVPLHVERQERLNTAMADYESALKRGDDIAAAVHDNTIERLLAESRAERQTEGASESNNELYTDSATPAEPEPLSYDGGVRRPAPRKREPLGMGDAIKAELDARAEIRARNQDAQRAWRR